MVASLRRIKAKRPWWERLARARAVKHVRWLRRELASLHELHASTAKGMRDSLDRCRRLEREIDELNGQTERDATRIRVLETENEILAKQVETMALVIVRDRERVITETDILVKLRSGVGKMASPTAVLAEEMAGE